MDSRYRTPLADPREIRALNDSIQRERLASLGTEHEDTGRQWPAGKDYLLQRAVQKLQQWRGRRRDRNGASGIISLIA
jgi:hypothetical protein